MKSKIGMTLAGIYLAVTILTIIYSLTCDEGLCDLVIALPILPWQFLLQRVVEFSWVLYGILILVNATIFYLIGAGVSRLIARAKNMQTPPTPVSIQKTPEIPNTIEKKEDQLL